ncbi:MAG TPA: PQQ-binding-like beta-propeller repeat protein [Chthoniobacteraceae bacterium]|jgi:outer membrane protein assembly factor BamB|nr:PQQ-binding-like beta-propeller repeat protein [Chthoniobacteraceae bacterium]
MITLPTAWLRKGTVAALAVAGLWALPAPGQSEERRPAGRAPEEAPRNLQVAWKFKRFGASFLSSPAWKAGRLYAASCETGAGGTSGSIFCLDGATGKLIWEAGKLEGRPLKGFFSSPALTPDGRSLLIGEGLHLDAGSHLICLEALTGQLRWQIAAPKNHFESSPAIAGDSVVIGAGAIERADQRPAEDPGSVLWVRISDGRLLWQRAVIDPESSPALRADGKAAFFGSGVGGNAVVAFDAAGGLLWRTPTRYPATGDISLHGNLAILGCGRGDFTNASPRPAGAVQALEQSSGRLRWKNELGDAVLGHLAIRDDTVFCPVRDGTVAALDAGTGATLWRRRLTKAPVLAGTACRGGLLYAVSSDGLLAILDAKSGEVLEKHALNDDLAPFRQNLCISTPLVAGGRVFVGSESGGLRCYVGGASR